MASTYRDYYALRAEQEKCRAKEAPSEMVARIHRNLADQYDQLAAASEQRPLGWAIEDPTR